VTPLVGVSLVLNTPTPIHIGDVVQIMVVMTPVTASNQNFTWTVTNGINGNIFTTGPAQNGNIVYLDAAQVGTSVFTVTTADGNKQASISLTVSPY
jgi:VCBS repeat-containing protein